jgi:hypothetical protein
VAASVVTCNIADGIMEAALGTSGKVCDGKAKVFFFKVFCAICLAG